ncbi:chemotaxis protein CheD [Ectopseudomonas mendocina]|uniref:Probable chemoreceptor glutamine deamidase CheD n=1 Tax=Ectopseudomonas mendocina TaxID=300 RepID=A0ABZ2RIF0_ECTME
MTERVFLNPGQLYFGGGDVAVETLLGPCVAIVMWYPGLSVGGMCHFQLPAASGCNPDGRVDGRYGDQAWRWLIQQAQRQGLSAEQAVYKLFGGARSFSGRPSLPGLDVAAQNVVFAERLLASRNLPVLARDLGGHGYRYVRFELASGNVWVRRGAAVKTNVAEVKR